MEKITDLKVWAQEIPLAVDFPTSYKYRIKPEEGRITHHVFVRLQAGNLTGWGEGTELTMFTGATSSTMAEIIRSQFASSILGLTLNGAFRAFREIIVRHPHNPGAKLGIEMALYDLLGKKLGVPLYELLGRRMRNEIPICYHIGALPATQAAKLARDAIQSGFRTLKLKADGQIPADVERIHAVLEAMPSDCRLRVDANQGWENFRRSGQVLRKLACNQSIEYIEQPVLQDRPEDMRKLSDQYGIPIFADESVITSRDAMRLLEADLVDGICIKVAKCGSLAEGVLISQMAALHNVPVTPVCAYATSLGAMAMTHLAAVVPLLSSAVELTPWMLKEDLAKSKLKHAPVLPIPETVGVGTEIEMKFFHL
jgi:L-alanine-DL-glutamate epimerase-like enolase superfamily enzyme